MFVAKDIRIIIMVILLSSLENLWSITLWSIFLVMIHIFTLWSEWFNQCNKVTQKIQIFSVDHLGVLFWLEGLIFCEVSVRSAFRSPSHQWCKMGLRQVVDYVEVHRCTPTYTWQYTGVLRRMHQSTPVEIRDTHTEILDFRDPIQKNVY